MFTSIILLLNTLQINIYLVNVFLILKKCFENGKMVLPHLHNDSTALIEIKVIIFTFDLDALTHDL